MKKLFGTLCVCCLLASMTACGGTESSVSTADSEATTTTTTKSESSVCAIEDSTVEDSSDESSEQNTESSEDSSKDESNPAEKEKATALSVLTYLQKNTPDIGNYVEYDEDTDTNGLLGRPGQYTSKINFAITTLEQTDENDPIGGSIEVFETAKDATARSEYIQKIGESMPILAEYNFVCDYVLLRIDFDVKPSAEAVYEEAVAAYMKSLK